MARLACAVERKRAVPEVDEAVVAAILLSQVIWL
jgi:hypothetical protein